MRWDFGYVAHRAWNKLILGNRTARYKGYLYELHAEPHGYYALLHSHLCLPSRGKHSALANHRSGDTPEMDAQAGMLARTAAHSELM